VSDLEAVWIEPAGSCLRRRIVAVSLVLSLIALAASVASAWTDPAGFKTAVAVLAAPVFCAAARDARSCRQAIEIKTEYGAVSVRIGHSGGPMLMKPEFTSPCLIVRRAEGATVAVRPDSVDADSFRRLAAAGRRYVRKGLA
jgi:hypothetical protein